MTDADTVLASFMRLAEREPDVVATMEKRLGRWRRRTRAELLDDAAALRVALYDAGVGRDTTVLLACAGGSRWLVADLAVQATGARVCAVAPTAPAAAIAHALAVSGATWVIAAGRHVIAATLAAERDAGGGRLRRLVSIEDGGLRAYGDDRLVTFDELMEAGRGAGADRAGMRAAVAELGAGDGAVVGLSSGVTGQVRAVTLSHGGLLAGTRGVIAALSLGAGDRLLAYRPLSEAVERTTTIDAALLSGATLCVPESRTAIRDAMYEIAPTCVHLTPRFLDRVASDVRARLSSSRGLKGWVGRSWLRAVDRRAGGRRGLLGRALVAFPVLEKLGLDKARAVVVSGGELSPDVRHFLGALGLPVRTALSLTEAGGVVSLSAPGWPDAGTCGRPLPGVEAHTDERSGELLLRGPMIATGDGGWLATGDRGRSRDGELILEGRIEALAALASGAPVALQPIEAALRASLYVREAVVSREGGRTVVVLELVESTVGRWARERGLAHTSYRSLLALPEVQRLAGELVEGVLAGTPLGHAEEVRLLRSPLEGVPGALTLSERPRRGAMLAAAVKVDPGTASPAGVSPAS